MSVPRPVKMPFCICKAKDGKCLLVLSQMNLLCPKKSQLIEYLNEEQPEELMDFAQVFLNLDRQNLAKVRLQDIGKTGLLLAIKDNQKRHSEHFVVFFVCCNLAMILGCDILNWCKILPKCLIYQLNPKQPPTYDIIHLWHIQLN